MKIFAIYPNAEGYGRVPTGLAIILTVLDKAGHIIELFDTTFLKGCNIDNDIREKAKLVLPVDVSSLYESHTNEEISRMLESKVKDFQPDLIAVSLVEDNYRFAHLFLGIVKKMNASIPVIVGGPTPSAAPSTIIDNPNIDYLIQGDGEEALLEFCSLMERGKSVEGVRILWYKKNGKVRNNPLCPFTDMDTIPVQNLDYWDKRHFKRPYNGKLYVTGCFEMSRGCPNDCTYCVNHAIKESLRGAGKYFRRKSPENTIKDIKFNKEKHKLERVVFCDDNFLLMPIGRLVEFAEAWKAEINLPYWINTVVETIKHDNLALLKETGCDGIGIGVEAGSEWFRKNILFRYVKNSRIIKTFKLIQEYGIRTTANIMIGFPGESVEDIFETIELVKRIGPDSFDISFVQPYIGTGIHAISKKLNYIEVSDTPGFRSMATEISFRGHPTIKNPHISPEQMVELYYNMPDYIKGTVPIPEKYIKSASVSEAEVRTRNDISREIAKTL
jgi:radical SAM superfamily enzyme YgiQ (UPF0313 family)